MPGASVSAYVIHWNAPAWCEETVESLLASRDVHVEVTVIDNASTELPDLPETVTVERLPTNRGFAGGANVALSLFAARADDGDVCCITSHDLCVAEDALHRCVVALEKQPAYGVLGVNGGTVDEVAGVVDQPWISGTCLLLRPACIADVGEFDRTYGSYVEDIDYCYRAAAKGWKIGIVADANATSHGSSDAARAVVLTRANHTLLAAKRGEYVLVLRRLVGMAWRAMTVRGEQWPESLLQTVKQLSLWATGGGRKVT